MASDPYKNDPQSRTDPLSRSFAVAPDDAADLAVVTRALQVNVAGNVKVTMADDPDAAPQIVFLAAGVWHPMRVKRVWNTSTTATGIHGGY